MNTYLLFRLDNFCLYGMYEADSPQLNSYQCSKPLGHALLLASDPYNCVFEQLADGSWQAVDPA
jgi:hypothetical protein